MTAAMRAKWSRKRTPETRRIEQVLREAGFEHVDAYRYNSASIRVRVIDSKFERVAMDKRDGMVDPALSQLPEEVQADILMLLTFAPSELEPNGKLSRYQIQNVEFDDPSPSAL